MGCCGLFTFLWSCHKRSLAALLSRARSFRLRQIEARIARLPYFRLRLARAKCSNRGHIGRAGGSHPHNHAVCCARPAQQQKSPPTREAGQPDPCGIPSMLNAHVQGYAPTTRWHSTSKGRIGYLLRTSTRVWEVLQPCATRRIALTYSGNWADGRSCGSYMSRLAVLPMSCHPYSWGGLFIRHPQGLP